MLIGASLIVMLIMVLLNLIMGNDFLSRIASIGVENEAIIDGIPNTFEVEVSDVLFSIDTSTIVGAISIIAITIIAVAVIAGVTVLATGFNSESVKVIIICVSYTGVWTLLSFLAYSLIISIEVFGAIIYVMLTLAYIIGVIQSFSGGND